ncbi:MAG: lipopolysaccharide heptosyltransferase II, partial [Gammaproteobacteria bacterium]|nr:lipopolysaccharide heptosyltransferase II [Gammaproteobacteria bacterium]
AIASEIAALGGEGCRNLCGETTLEEVIDLLALVDVAVSNDSGLMHVAAAVGVSVIALYGSSSPAYTPPLTQQAEIFSSSLSCSPCYQRRCSRYPHPRCLEEIEVDAVLAAVERKLLAKI